MKLFNRLSRARASDELQYAKQLWQHLRSRCRDDRISVVSGYLTYITLLSLVPLLAVVFSVFSLFPGFQQLRTRLEEALFDNLVPTATEVIRENINAFIANASGMTTVGVLALLLVAIMLISTVDKTINHIWRSPRVRPRILSFAVYWMVLTLGPLLLGLSLTATSAFVSLQMLGEMSFIKALLLKLIPLLSSVGILLVLYQLVPNKPVQFRHALIGALIASIAFEISKRVFAIYLENFPSYQVIYGALAAIPILFVWVHTSWFVVLLGAELTVSLNEVKCSVSNDKSEQNHDRTHSASDTGQR